MSHRHGLQNCGIRVVLAGFVGGLAGCVSNSALAQPMAPEVFRLPVSARGLPAPGPAGSPQIVSRSGLELKVDTRWADSYGYRPLRFTFSSPQPVTSDTQITARFYVDDWTDHNFNLYVEQDGELKTGEQDVTVTVLAPQYDSWNLIRWDVWVDGIIEPALSLDRNQVISFNRWQQGGLTLFFPAVGQSAPQEYVAMPPQTDAFAGIQTNRITGPLPSDWLDYTCFDFVIISIDDLLKAHRTRPAETAALRTWVRAGGNLWVENTGTLPDRLAKVDELLSLRIDPLPQPLESADKLPGSWSFLSFQAAARARENDGDSIDGMPSNPLWMDLLARATQDSRNWFAERPAGFGTVTAFVREWNTQPGDLQRGTRGLTARRWALRSWLPRHGLAPNQPNREFSNFLIPGVGLAPVTEFRVLITLFVLLIGPINYWVLSRAKRLYLLVLTVPLGAAAVTLLLFSYAFLADGFATQLRARSLTILDQVTGEAASWSRLSYYAGFAPAEGLSFPQDTAVYPILPEYLGRNMQSQSRGQTVLWSDGEQSLRRGWLTSRTPTQFLAIRAHESPARLDVRAAQDHCRVTNRLGAAIERLIVVDESGKLWQGTEIAIDAPTNLTEMSQIDAMRLLRESLVASRPQLPAELQAAVDASRQQDRRNRGRYGVNRYREEADFRLSSNLLESGIDKLAELSSGSAGTALPPRSYLAIAATTIDTPLGLEDVEQVDGYHLVLGRW